MNILSEILTFSINFTTHIFLFSIVFILQYRLRKNRLGLLIAGSALFLLGPYTFKLITHASFYSNPVFMIGWYSSSYLVLCAYLFVLYCLSFQVKAKEVALIICVSYLIQNILFHQSKLVPAFMPGIQPTTYKIGLMITVISLSIVTYVLLKKQVIHFDISRVRTPVALTCLIGLFLALTVISQWINTINITTEAYNTLGVSIYAELTSVVLLITLFIIFGNSELKHENLVIRQLLKQAEKQHTVSQEKIDYINQRVHDLKHQIAAIRVLINQGEENLQIQDKLAELEKTAKVYDDIVITGNSIVDSVLTEQKLVCNKNQIKLDYVIDGHLLDFMETMDIYVIFGNALDNAIESVMKIDDVSKRIISVSVGKKGKMVFINVDNYFESELKIQDGLPITSKKDKDFHGYGIKSIRYIAQKYDGYVSISTAQKHFCLSIVLPEGQIHTKEEDR